ncbi:MAG: hypothetical protein GXP37_07950 [Chloroflexi bacterium]|nr:hypothetical protein [Chloroflexota bacterium]
MLTFLQRTLSYRGREKAWQQKFNPLAPKADDMAPDFALAEVGSERMWRLSDFRGQKPVVLIFGSFT